MLPDTDWRNAKMKHKPLSGQETVLEHLAHRLILLYTASTGAILALTLFLTALYNQTQAQLYAREAFFQLFTTIEAKIQNENKISYSWLSKLEQDYHCNIYIEDNGHGLSYRNSYPFATNMAVLMKQIKEKARAAGIQTDHYPLVSGRSDTGTLMIKGQAHDSYLAAVSQISSGENWQTIFVIQEQNHPVVGQVPSLAFFLLLFFCGLILLYLISHSLIRKTMKPVRESLQKQRDFIAAASHELRSPLAVLRINLSALRQTLPGSHASSGLEPPCNNTSVSAKAPHLSPSELQQEALSDMEEEIVRMSALVEDMLFLASMDASGSVRWQTNLRLVELDAFLIDLYEDFLPLATEHRMDLTLLLPDTPLPSCMADPDRLRQLFSILFDNALCYAREGEKLELFADTKGRIALIDHGSGIPEEKRAHIFERFARGDASRTDRTHYGLGLSIAAELAALHRASLTCEETPGGGCTFVLQLPPPQKG